jgi:hypothetical protein
MSYKVAVHHAHLILGLYGKAIKYTRDLFDPPDVSTHRFVSSACTVNHFFLRLFLQNEVESIRMITMNYEMIIAQHGNFTLVVTQSNVKVEEVKAVVEGVEKKEGEPEKKEAS